ncbi:hypothetical protein MYX75_01065 [Acidobacteria bacterium AH-259-A15]|nr:hypothetical protein [Acidobacteria bacterium AH-259-A15]
MSNFTYLKSSDNLVSDALLTPTSVNSVYPVANLSILPIFKIYRTTEGGIGTQKIRIDFPTAQSIDTFAVVNHNLTSGATITVKGGSSPDPDGSAFTTTITWRELLAWKILTAAESHKNWSITLDDEANVNGYLSVGYLIMGTKTTFSVQFQPEWTKEPVKVVRAVENDLGVPMVGRKVSEGTRVTVSFAGLSTTERNEIDTFLDSLDLRVDPFLLVPDSTEADAFFVRLEESYVIEQGSGVAGIEAAPFLTDNFGAVVAETPPFHYEV